MKKSKKRFNASPKDLATLATYLDGYAALSVSDPSRIRSIFKRNMEDRDVEGIWKEVEKDVRVISALPSASNDIMKLSRRVEIAKPVSMFLPLMLFVIYIALGALGVMRGVGEAGNLAFLAIFVCVYILAFSLYILLNRKLSKTVDRYYDSHSGEVLHQRKRIKLANQRVIDKIAMIVRARNVDPSKYKFRLVHNDYANIEVMSEDKNRIYTVAVKGKGFSRPKPKS